MARYSVLAIDPGSEQSALVVWDGKKIQHKAITPNKQLISILHWGLPDDFALINCLAIEQVRSYGMPVGATVFDTVEWTGRFIQWWLERGKRAFVRVPRMEVKMHLCHTPRAKDSNIRQTLIDRFGPPGVKKKQGLTYGLKKDLWAAFAVAVTHWDKHEQPPLYID